MKTIALFAGLLSLLGSAQAQTSLQCNASVPKPLATSGSGTSELVGDYLVTCVGGVGQTTATLTIFTNTNVSTASAPTLLIDDGTGGSVTGTFPGAVNSVVFSNVTFQSPGTSSTRTLRVAGLRVNANQLGISSTSTPTQVAEFMSSGSVSISNPTQNVAIVLAPGAVQCSASATPLAVSPSGTSELAGPYVLTCVGGSNYVTTDVDVLLNTNISQTQAPTLLIDDGVRGSVTGTFGQTANLVTFKNVTFLAPGTAIPRTLKVTGMRVNAAQIGLSAGGVAQITAYAAVLNTVVRVSSPSSQTVATISVNAPVLKSVSPGSATAGGAFVLSVFGDGFDFSSVVVWQIGFNSYFLATTVASSTQLTAIVPANLIPNPGIGNISVQTVGGTSSAVAFPITAVTVPSVVSLQPVASSGTAQSLTFQFSHPSGYTNLNVVNALINFALDGRQGCYIAYARAANTLLLINDTGDAGGPYAGSMVMNGSGSVSNSQCTVIGAGSLVVGSGNALTLTLNMIFSSGFGGNRVIYAAARDASGGNSGWNTLGVHGVPPLPTTFPNPVSVSPASGSTANSLFTLTYQDTSSATNLQTSWVLVNTALDGRAACYVAYYRPGNQVFLVPDSGDGTLATSMSLSGTGSLSNSQCTVSAQGSSAVVSGSALTVSLNVTFKSPAFTGPRGIWLATSTPAGQVSPWQALGAWLVP